MAVGENVVTDQVVAEVESAKAAVEIPVPFAGRVVTLHARVGERVEVGGPLVTIEGGDGAGVRAEAVAGAGPEAAGEAAEVSGSGSGSGPVLVGYGTVPVADVPGDGLAPRAISPLVRRMAAENGLDLAALAREAPHGVVRRRDVEAALAGRESGPPASGAEEDRVPLRGVGRAMAERVARSRREIPDASVWVDVDATELVALRDQLRESAPELGIGLLALVARVCVVGLTRFPELNARVDARRGELVRLRDVRLGFAAQTPRGLVVPVVRDARRLSTAELAGELRRLGEAARGGTLSAEAMAGGTFTVNNYGVFGVDGATPIINHPEAAMLGVGRVVQRPWVVDGALAVRWVTQLSITFDHRVCDGGTAGGFLRFVADHVERPALLTAYL
ncbi:dihydrolipoamide acetyltransferase family protein [Streptomyces triticirhizae]|uniref:dihydrolipoamide acetyltransferase family protein n=1 Tax=Streptomyces triticirhizae TaxID=2483353 RepID=UPI00389A6D68